MNVPGSSTNENAQLPSGMLGVFVAKGYFYKVKQPPASSGCFGSGVFEFFFVFGSRKVLDNFFIQKLPL